MSTHQYTTPEEAEQAFYEAIEKGDLDQMMSVWCAEEDVVCIHPGGPRIDGYQAVRESWRLMLSQASGLRFRLSDVRRFSGLSYAVHVLCEWVSEIGDPLASTPLFATNAYHLTERGWRMVLHHACAAPEGASAEHESPMASNMLH